MKTISLPRILIALFIFWLSACGKPGDVSSVESNPSNDARMIRNGTDESSQTTGKAGSTGQLNWNGEMQCSATLISPNTILTAAHCISGVPNFKKPSGALLPASQFKFHLNGESRSIAAIKRHPNYLPLNTARHIGGSASQDSGGADLAILKLSSPIFLTKYQDRLDRDFSLSYYPSATIYGFGRNEDNVLGVRRSGTVNYAGLYNSTELVSYNAAKKKGTFRSRSRGFVQYLPGSSNQISCNGDSGGGSFTGSNLNGVASYVYYPNGTDEQEVCRRVEAAVYTTVSAYAEWIKSTRTSLDPDLVVKFTATAEAKVAVNTCFPITERALNAAGGAAKGGVNINPPDRFGSSIPMFEDSNCIQPVSSYGIRAGQSSRVIYGKASVAIHSLHITFFDGFVGPLYWGEYFPIPAYELTVWVY